MRRVPVSCDIDVLNMFCSLSCMLPVEQIGPLVQWGEWVKEVKDIAMQFCEVFYDSVKSIVR